MRADDLSDDSIRAIYDQVARDLPHGIFVELGCLCGASTIYLAQQAPDAIIYAIDLWKDCDARGNPESFFDDFWVNVQKAGCVTNIRPIMADSAKAAQLFADKSVNFVFIDADHDYEPVTRDILAWLPKIKDGGCMGGHDYDYHVQKAVHRIFDNKAERVINNSWLVKL